ncbi:MAG: DUF885 domain-containing protein [Brevundimonas sp.]
MIDRRRLMLSSAGLGLMAALPVAAQTPAPALSPADARLDAMLTRWFEENVDLSPEYATGLGLDRGARAALSGQLRQSGIADAAADRARARARWAEIQTVSPDGLSDQAKVSLAVYRFSAEGAARAADVPYGGGVSPYVVTQRSGAYFSVPDFMANQHRLETEADAAAFISRLSAFARLLDQENERITADAALGVMLPSFLMDKTLIQLRTLRDTPAYDMAMLQALIRKTDERNMMGDWGAQAAHVINEEIKPALSRQIAVFEAQRPNATDDAGAWKLPQGETIYALALRNFTTTEYSAQEIHDIGLQQVAAIQAEIDAILKGMGMTEGSVGARIKALSEDPQHLWPNTDEAKVELIGSLNRQMEALEPLLPRVFNTLPGAKVEIRRVPPSIELGAPGGYYQAASLDGSRPGAYYINLSNTANWPKWGLPTLTYHEASPGHHFQITVAREAGSLPIYRRIAGNSAYNEGWALYAERVAADDLDVYAGNPLGRVGYLQSYLFRAVRLVVDTGLHHKRWSRDQAIRYMIEECGEPPESAEKEIDRYCVSIGQACSYKLGQTVIARLRAEAEARPGFDLKTFHDRVLLNGSVPLAVLEDLMRA